MIRSGSLKDSFGMKLCEDTMCLECIWIGAVLEDMFICSVVRLINVKHIADGC